MLWNQNIDENLYRQQVTYFLKNNFGEILTIFLISIILIMYRNYTTQRTFRQYSIIMQINPLYLEYKFGYTYNLRRYLFRTKRILN